MSILICSTVYGGCGHVGHPNDWHSLDKEGNHVICNNCGEDHMFQLTEENFERIIGTTDRTLALSLLKEEANGKETCSASPHS